nr:MAG TPA: hypothetical protein [Caudoviricetes sp.]
MKSKGKELYRSVELRAAAQRQCKRSRELQRLRKAALRNGIAYQSNTQQGTAME